MTTLKPAHLDAAITGWVTPAWAAEILGRKQRTIRHWARAGELPLQRHPQLGLMVDMAACARLDGARPKQDRGRQKAG